MDIKTYITEPSEGYELLDSGDGEKLERYGTFVVSRPDPQALWKKHLSQTEWDKAQAVFLRTDEKAGWRISKDVPTRWEIAHGDFKFYIKPTSFKHTGLFPEQSENWKFIREIISREIEKRIPSPGTEKVPKADEVGELREGPGDEVSESEDGKPKVLNLFGYTGGATLAAAAAGASVVHIDGSKVALQWAKDNAQLSGLGEKPVRWLLDDAFAFVQREIRRGNKYDAIMMDPPSFGHGPKGELWKIEENFIPLLDECKKLLSDNPLFIIINGYAAGYSPISYFNALSDMMKDYNGTTTIGELTIKESHSGRLLPSGIVARWQAH